MQYAVELFFNNELEKIVLDLWHKLADAGISSSLLDIGSRPHLCLAVLEDADITKLCWLVWAFAGSTPFFTVGFDSVGTFLTDEGVVFLSPAKADKLLEVHSNFHQRLKAKNFHSHSYYIPGNWRPHCTVAVNVEGQKLQKAVEYCRQAEHRFYGEIAEIGIVKFEPLKELTRFKLKASRNTV